MLAKFKTIATTTAFAAVLAFGAQSASATTTTPTTCDIINFTTSTACVSPVSGGSGGNVTVSEMNDQSIFGANNWSKIGKIDLPGTTETFSLTVASDGKSGTWMLNAPFTWGTGIYAFAIKGSTDNAVYLMDKNFTDGTWNTTDLFTKSGNNPALSNITLFGTTGPSVVPLPAAGWLLLMGIGGLGVASRRRRKALAS